MGLLFQVLYAAHARGTHHKLALDALQQLAGPDAEGWRRLFLKHAEAFLAGAKAPDDTFKDFKNHVLHVRDGFWGGAPEAAREWYGRLVAALEASAWSEAAYAAGVLSHYVTDPVHPFHTGQTEAENAIHRACEWSTAQSYIALKRVVAGEPAPVIRAASGPDWLAEMLRAAATEANTHYEKLIAHYDINTGVVDPPAGLDPVAQRITGRLIRLAAALFAHVLQRALDEAGASPPVVSLTLDTVLATLKVPFKAVLNRMADASDRREVERIYDELQATGTVEKNLPEDDRTVRDLHQAEVLRGRTATLAPPVVVTAARQRPSTLTAMASVPSVPLVRREPPPEPAPGEPRQASLSDRLAGLGDTPGQPAPEPQERRRPSEPRLKPADDVVDAPSIGPRMAERLRPIGVRTVEDLLGIRAERIAEALGRPVVTADTVAAWQAQARLVCAVPGLTGTGAQLFVSAGYRTPGDIAAAEADRLCADVLAFAASEPGRRILRMGEPPDIERIKAWAEAARLAKAA